MHVFLLLSDDKVSAKTVAETDVVLLTLEREKFNRLIKAGMEHTTNKLDTRPKGTEPNSAQSPAPASSLAEAEECARSVYYGLLGLTAGAPLHEGRKPAGALVILGFAVFCVLFLASFTGATAAILIAQNERSGELSSVSDVAQRPAGAKLCMMGALESRFLLRYPSMTGRVVSSETVNTVLQGMDDGQCIAAVLFQDAWENALTGAYPTAKNDGSSKELNHCDKVTAGGSLISTANVMPVRRDLREALTYHLRSIINYRGSVFQKLQKDWDLLYDSEYS